MARRSWFDPESNEMMFSNYMEQMESWQRAFADGVVEPDEVRQQAEHVSQMLRAPTLNKGIPAHRAGSQ